MGRKLFIFDWDGTLVDSLGHIYECGAKRIFEHYGVPVPDLEAYRSQVTTDYMSSFYWPNGIPREATADDLNAIMAAGLKERGDSARLFPEVRETLNRLYCRQSILAVVSAHHSVALVREIRRHGPDDVISEVKGDVVVKSEEFLKMMRKVGSSPRDTYCVGDMVHDAEAAQAAGARPYAYPHGFHSRQRLEAFKGDNPELRIIDSLLDLVDVV